MEEYLTDCYNKDFNIKIGDHDDPNLITIFHIANIALPSNPNTKVEVIIRDHDDINNPSFYILSEDRSKELYRVSLFDNSYTEGLSKEDKEALNEFLRSDLESSHWGKSYSINAFKKLKNYWTGGSTIDPDTEEKYNSIMEPPYYE